MVQLQRWLMVFCVVFTGFLVASTVYASEPSKQTMDILLKEMLDDSSAASQKVVAPPLKTDETSLRYNFVNRLNSQEVEAFNVVLPSGWTVGYSQLMGSLPKQGVIYEFVNSSNGQTMKNWSEMVALTILKTTEKNENANDAKYVFLTGESRRASNVGWNAAKTLRESPQDSLASWEEHNGRGDKEIIVRFLKNKTDIYTIMYQSKVRFLNDPVKKQQWLDWLDTATLKVIKNEAVLKN